MIRFKSIIYNRMTSCYVLLRDIAIIIILVVWLRFLVDKGFVTLLLNYPTATFTDIVFVFSASYLLVKE